MRDEEIFMAVQERAIMFGDGTKIIHVTCHGCYAPVPYRIDKTEKKEKQDCICSKCRIALEKGKMLAKYNLL